ncbi:protein of unknown function [Nitrospira japonica]|uniref:Uncharacterized protein n=1 Tax=Nitrospira japonica TaxID=1325564 RepID=A0A1W1I211_9BACT|nr:protein of unknown function [Nitrospira japonica]
MPSPTHTAPLAVRTSDAASRNPSGLSIRVPGVAHAGVGDHLDPHRPHLLVAGLVGHAGRIGARAHDL